MNYHIFKTFGYMIGARILHNLLIIIEIKIAE